MSGGIVKACSKCGEIKPTTDFYSEKAGKFGVRADCKECNRAKIREWSKDNPGYYKAYVLANPEKEKARRARYRADNGDRMNAAVRRWEIANPDAVKEGLLRNRGKRLASIAKRKAADPERFRAYALKHMRAKRLTPRGKLDSAIRTGIKRGLIKGGKYDIPTYAAVGYTQAELMDHLSKLLCDGMDWSNYGKGGWHIDHIIPLSAFNYSTVLDIDFKRAWALSNLQPMWELDNLVKGTRLNAPFQPSFAFSS